MPSRSLRRVVHGFAAALLAVLVSACGGEGGAGPGADSTATARPTLETKADTVAMQLYDAMGGPQAWKSLPALEFAFAVGQGGERRPVAQHYWNRRTGDYRVEWQRAPDSSYAAVFNVRSFDSEAPEGQATLNGQLLDASARAEALAEGFHRFVNDTYWMLAPVKLFDEGVQRTYVADSSDADTDVLRLSFGDVGLTPGDRYWLYVDRDTGRLRRWAFVLQGMDADAAPRAYEWTGYESFEAPEGRVLIATRKPAVTADTSRRTTIHTDEVRTPERLPDSLFAMP